MEQPIKKNKISYGFVHKRSGNEISTKVMRNLLELTFSNNHVKFKDWNGPFLAICFSFLSLFLYT